MGVYDMQIFQSFRTLTVRLLAILMALFLVIAAIVYAVIELQGKPKISSISADTMIETGNEAVNAIMANINHVDGMATAASSMAGALPKQSQLYEDSLAALMQASNKQIVGGGVWFDPNMYQHGVERQSFVWIRDHDGHMQQTSHYNDPQRSPNPYYRDWWYMPAMYASHNHCVWSRAYIDPVSHYPMMTCAKAIYNHNTLAFEGVASFNVLLDNLKDTMASWQQKTGGYTFLVDLDNRFLTFPNDDLVKQVTVDNPQGEMLQVSDLATNEPNFAPIADALDELNTALITDAKAADEGKFDITASSILATINTRKISSEEAKVLAALLLTNGKQSLTLDENHFVRQIAIERDFLLGEPATAFVFSVPFTYWKMVIVKPNSEMMAVANGLSKQLQWYLLIGFIPALLVCAWAFRQFFAQPLRRVAQSVSVLGSLIEQKKYLQLSDHKLPHAGYAEIDIISDSMNQLIIRVVENEGALAQINVHLEKQVEARTQELQQALTELKASQVQLVRSEKMATLGQMVAGVAHEVNTPLGYVRSNLELVSQNISRFDELIDHTETLLKTLKDTHSDPQAKHDAMNATLQCCEELQSDQVSEDLREIVQDGMYGVDQIAELVVNLRDFSRLDEAKIKQVNINDCIKSSLTMARNNLKTLHVYTDLQPLPEISCNPSQINQVLINLFNNAAQAIEPNVKGELSIHSAVVGGYVTVKVKDNGSGMDKQVAERIFEPFFTTKKAGEGTGLGLAIASQIMEQHQGDISVQSARGEGTTFTLRLPVVTTKAEVSKKSRLLLES